MKIILLGSGGWIPTKTRETCCLFVRKGPDVLIVDAGTGLAHLVGRAGLFVGAEAVYIALTHFHLDHVVGLAYLPGLNLPARPVIWGPGEALYGTPTASVLGRLLEPPFFPPGLASIASVRELTEGSNEIGHFTVVARRQIRHSEPTFAFRIDDEVAYCTDTAFDPENAAFAHGCSILFHEAWSADPDGDAQIHTAAHEAAEIAHRAGVGELVLIHVNPLLDDSALNDTARTRFAHSALGTDLREYEVG